MLIYLARNRLNGKVYIGQTIVSLRERMGDHRRKAFLHESRSHFHAAIRKYGFDAFEWRTLERILVREALNPAERFWIRKYGSASPRKGYNNTHGGDTFEFTEETKRKISAAGKGRKLKPAQIETARIRMRGTGNPFHGQHHTDEANAKNRAAHIGKKLRPEHVAKCVHLGESNGMAKLDSARVLQIKKMLGSGMRNCAIQREMGISKSTLQGIKRGSTWRHVQI